MMETPRNTAGEITEQIMAQAEVNIDNRKAPKLTTAQYNSLYEAVYDVIAERLKP
ncbi:MAG: hypothetical protein ABT940_00465 [Alphaproteobacteria bacterium]